MPWMILLFVILPIILVLQKTFEHGYGWLIILPIFGLIAIFPFGYAWKKAGRLGFVGAVVVRCCCVAAFAYLGKKVYIGTLPAWEFPTVQPGQLRGDEGASIVGWGGLLILCVVTFFVISRNARKPEKD